ncbi:MAG: hypothetical protein ACK5XX_08770 [Holosporales bacterium]
MSTQRSDLFNAELELHRFTIESSGGGQQAQAIISLSQKVNEIGSTYPYTQYATITLVNPDVASSVGVIAIKFNHVANKNKSIEISVQPRDPSFMGDVNEETNTYERGAFDDAVHRAIPAISNIPKGEFERPRVTTSIPHQDFIASQIGVAPKYGIKIAEECNGKKRLEGIGQLCSSELLSENPEIRSLIGKFIERTLDGTLFKQQILEAGQNMKALKSTQNS